MEDRAQCSPLGDSGYNNNEVEMERLDDGKLSAGADSELQLYFRLFNLSKKLNSYKHTYITVSK